MYQVQANLEEALKQWSLYNNALQRSGQVLTEMEYAFSRYSTASGDLPEFSQTIHKLEVKGQTLN